MFPKTIPEIEAFLITSSDWPIEYVKVFVGMIISPRVTMKKFVEMPETSVRVPVAFLIANLVLAGFVGYIPSFFGSTDVHFLDIAKDISTEVPKFIIGTAAFLFLVRSFRFGSLISIKKFATVVCCASVIYPISAVLVLPFGDRFVKSMVTLCTSVIYGQVHDWMSLRHLLQSFAVSIVVLVWVELGIVCWWVVLLYRGMAFADTGGDPATWFLKLGYSLSSYVCIKSCAIVIVMLNMIIALILSINNFESMKKDLADTPPKYADVLMHSTALLGFKALPVYGQYIANLYSALAQSQVYSQNNPSLEDVRRLLESKKYRAAQMALNDFVSAESKPLGNPKRILLANVEEILKESEKLHSSPYYTEAPEQNIFIMQPIPDLWCNLIP